jgi:hypothetical protein
MGKTPDGGGTVVWRINGQIMANNSTRRRKPDLSAHQKQMRFFTRLSVFMGFVFIAAIFWLVNRSSLGRH